MIRALLIALAIAGCGRHINPEFCAVHDDPECPMECDQMCAPRVCEPSQGVCVDCTAEHNPCPSTEPTCGADFHCHSIACDNCDSQVCKPDGTCEDPANVIYVSPTGSGTNCTINAKCTLRQGLTEIAGTRTTVSLAAGTYIPPDGAGLTIASVGGRLLGYGASLVGGGPVLDVLAGADVELDGLQIAGAMGAAGYGLRCAANARVRAFHLFLTNNIGMNTYAIESACDLTLDGSTLAMNRGSLHVTGGVIDIRNNLFVKNGKADLTTSPVVITGGATGGFRFNTIANNTTKMGMGPAGISCNPTDATVLNTDGNIITDNNDGKNYSQQYSGGCMWGTSYTSPGTGMNQLAWDPLSYHLTGQSPALVRDVDGVSCTNMTDIDGQARPINGGLKLACDYGADEYQPQP